MKLILEPEDYKSLRNVISETTGIIMTDLQIAELIGAKRHLGSQVYSHGVTDTDVRSQLGDAICQMLLGRNWPTYSEFKDLLFWDQLKTAAVMQGYAIRE